MSTVRYGCHAADRPGLHLASAFPKLPDWPRILLAGSPLWSPVCLLDLQNNTHAPKQSVSEVQNDASSHNSALF